MRLLHQPTSGSQPPPRNAQNACDPGLPPWRPWALCGPARPASACGHRRTEGRRSCPPPEAKSPGRCWWWLHPCRAGARNSCDANSGTTLPAKRMPMLQIIYSLSQVLLLHNAAVKQTMAKTYSKNMHTLRTMDGSTSCWSTQQLWCKQWSNS